MVHYIEAYYEDGSEILGNGDGQYVIRARDYKRTYIYQHLTNPRSNSPFPKWKKPAYWLIKDVNGSLVEKIPNKFKNIT